MPDSHRTSSQADFFAIAGELGFLDAPQVTALREECRASGLPPETFAADKGCLSGVDIDIVVTLAAADEAIPGYRMLGLIGKGGMGVVYRAEQRNLGRVVALKTILVSRMCDRGMLDRFELEARTIGQLRHPNIIAAHDFGRNQGRLYLAMELVEGTDLDRRIKTDGPLDEWLAWGLARQTAAGLSHAMQHRIVHRDVKPANLMLVEPPEGYPLPRGMPMVKIADFGLALLQEELSDHTRLTATDATLGSPHYMAPEQLESSDVDFRADMYALAGTLYHALTGRPPFAGMKLSQRISATLGEGPPPITSLREDLEPGTAALIGRLMARQPDDRPASYQELLAEIDAVAYSLNTRSLAAGSKLHFGSTEIPARSRAESTPGTSTDPQHSLRTLGEAELAAAGRWSLRERIGAIPRVGMLIGLVLLLAAGLWWLNRPEPVAIPVRPAGLQVGAGIPLFNGIDTRGWIHGHGNWIYRPEEAVLVGNNGLIERPIPPAAFDEQSQRPVPLRWYRLECIFLALASAGESVQELHFGHENIAGRDSPRRYVLQRTGERVVIGVRTSARNPFQADTDAPSLTVAPGSPVAITLERLSTGWFVDINGAAFCALPLRPQERPVFGLMAQGEAHFAEVAIYPIEIPQDAQAAE